LSQSLNLFNGGGLSDEVSNENATAYHLFFQWVNGTGADKREFNENSLMGQQMLESPEIVDAINRAISKAQKGDYSTTGFIRSLSDENFIGYAAGFPIEATDNAARAFHGSFSGTIEFKATTLKSGDLALLQMVVKFSDSMTALSGSRGPEIIGGYDLSNPTALYTQENPYGSQGQFSTINIDYLMKVNLIIKIKPTFKKIPKDKL